MTASALAQDDLAAVIGLEVHIQLETDTKIFCGCSTTAEADESPNSRTCPVCLGLPGALPVINEEAVRAAVKVGKALSAEIPEQTQFHRKNYYYPDLPKNFQITQYDAPICADGYLEIDVADRSREITVRRAHLEEDPGSLQHEGGNIETADYTLVNYNRAGTPLMEIVTEPDFRSPQETRAFLNKLEEVLEYLGVFDATRDGSLRIDANISIVPENEFEQDETIPDDVLAAANRTEVKNISSHKGAEQALAYEVTRQKNAVRRDRTIEQETRHWDEARGITVSMRSKEEEKDYRYFPEADLPPLAVRDWQSEIEIPELPAARRERFQREYHLDAESAAKLTSRKAVADFYETVADQFDPGFAATWVADTLLGELNYRDLSVDAIASRRDDFLSVIELVDAGEITAKNAEEVVLREMLDTGADPTRVIEKNDLGTADTDEVAAAVDSVIAENEDAVEDYHAGEDGALNFLIGQVMQKTGGSADPGIVNQQLREALS